MKEEAGGGRKRKEEEGRGRRRKEEEGGGGRRRKEEEGRGRRRKEEEGGGRRRRKEEEGGGGRRRRKEEEGGGRRRKASSGGYTHGEQPELVRWAGLSRPARLVPRPVQKKREDLLSWLPSPPRRLEALVNADDVTLVSPVLEGPAALGREHHRNPVPPAPDDLSIVCFTSGTTGNHSGGAASSQSASR
ncbi:Long-chain-fatty-acid--CoA ligase 5 [Liparis tanakae]|uniref:Long-chain-fatty-acid--CoA ligase 5 n=1 Tax=Liparis tanakae TaxID=230148 RepID=A0A4Z2E263_9TELE|nr:Long-chain-fatty-acid--CoA ligase 5 [Liparis tanakae]